jgi:malonyl-CoA decarboxylase
LLFSSEREALAALPGGKGAGGLGGLLGETHWHENRGVADSLRAALMRLCARFLLAEKGAQGRALDPVEHFHLTNGARVERLNWLADRSPKGLQQSAGIMVNYLYRLAEVESNHEAYTGEARVAASSAVKALARLRDTARSP